MDSGAQGQQQEGGGFNLGTTMGILMPMLGLAAGIARPETAQGFNALAYNERQAGDRRNEAASQSATAEQLTGLGFTADPRMGANQQLGFATLQQTMAENKRKAEEEAIRRAQEATSRKTYGDLASVRGQATTELPEDSAARLYALAPSVTNPEQATQFKETQESIAQTAKRLAEARAAARPFEQTEEYAFNTIPSLDVPSTLGKSPLAEAAGNPFDVGPLTMPEPISLTQVPDNVHALQRQVMDTGAMPKPEDAATQYGLPLTSLPGGREAHRAAVKPPYKPDVQYITDAQGRVTRDIVQADPDTGLPLQGLAPQDLGIIGKPQVEPQPQQPTQHEMLASLGYVLAGRPELAMPQHRNLSPTAATTVVDTIRRAQQEGNPALAAAIISQRLEHTMRLYQVAQDTAASTKDPQQRMRYGAEATQHKLVIDQLNNLLDVFIQGGMPKPATVGAPPPDVKLNVAPDAAARLQRLKAAGITK